MEHTKCNKCGADIDENIELCPNCGEEISSDEIILSIDENLENDLCGESEENICSDDTSTDLVELSNESKTNDNSIPHKMGYFESLKVDAKKRNIFIAISSILAIIILFAGINVIKNMKVNSYLEKYESTVISMQDCAESAEYCTDLIRDVWYNAIYKEYDTTTDKYTRPKGYWVDFNSALSNLFSDSEFLVFTYMVSSQQETIAGKMRELSSPPDGCEIAFSEIKTLYEALTQLTNCATNPNGSLTSFSSEVNTAKSNYLKYADSVKIYFR